MLLNDRDADLAVGQPMRHVLIGALLAAVACEIALAFAVYFEPSDAPAPWHGVFPDAGVQGLSTPFNITGTPDVDEE